MNGYKQLENGYTTVGLPVHIVNVALNTELAVVTELVIGSINLLTNLSIEHEKKKSYQQANDGYNLQNINIKYEKLD